MAKHKDKGVARRKQLAAHLHRFCILKGINGPAGLASRLDDPEKYETMMRALDAETFGLDTLWDIYEGIGDFSLHDWFMTKPVKEFQDLVGRHWWVRRGEPEIFSKLKPLAKMAALIPVRRAGHDGTIVR